MALFSTEKQTSAYYDAPDYYTGSGFVLGLLGYKKNGQKSTFGKVKDVALPILGGIAGTLIGGPAGAKIGAAAGQALNAGSNRAAKRIVGDFDDSEEAIDADLTGTLGRGQLGVGLSGLAGAVTTGIQNGDDLSKVLGSLGETVRQDAPSLASGLATALGASAPVTTTDTKRIRYFAGGGEASPGFAKRFAQERARQGAGGQFYYEGKPYTTYFREEVQAGTQTPVDATVPALRPAPPSAQPGLSSRPAPALDAVNLSGIRRKAGVKLDGVNPVLASYLANLPAELKKALVITSGMDSFGVHSPRSRHRHGNALDLRFNDALYAYIQSDPEAARLGLNMIDPNHGTAKHIHLQYAGDDHHYAEGGETGPGKPRKPLIVNRPDDPRLRAYQDSLQLQTDATRLFRKLDQQQHTHRGEVGELVPGSALWKRYYEDQAEDVILNPNTINPAIAPIGRLASDVQHPERKVAMYRRPRQPVLYQPPVYQSPAPAAGYESMSDYQKRVQQDEKQQFQNPAMRNTGRQFAGGGDVNKLGVKNSLWNNIRARRGSGKKPTKAMLEEEKKIRRKRRRFAGGGEVEPSQPFTYQYAGLTFTIEPPTDYQVYGENDKTEDLRITTPDGGHYGRMRVGERIMDQHSNLAMKAIMRSNVPVAKKQAALGEHLYEELLTHKTADGGREFAGGGVADPPEDDPVLAEYNRRKAAALKRLDEYERTVLAQNDAGQTNVAFSRQGFKDQIQRFRTELESTSTTTLATPAFGAGLLGTALGTATIRTADEPDLDKFNEQETRINNYIQTGSFEVDIAGKSRRERFEKMGFDAYGRKPGTAGYGSTTPLSPAGRQTGGQAGRPPATTPVPNSRFVPGTKPATITAPPPTGGRSAGKPAGTPTTAATTVPTGPVLSKPINPLTSTATDERRQVAFDQLSAAKTKDPVSDALSARLPGLNAAVEQVRLASLPAPAEAAKKRDYTGTAMDLGRILTGAVMGSRRVKPYELPAEYQNLRAELAANKDRGFSSEEWNTINGQIADNYAAGVGALSRTTGGGTTPGVVLAGLTRLNQQRGQQQQQAVLGDVAERNRNQAQYGQGVLRDVQFNRQAYEDGAAGILADQQAGAALAQSGLRNLEQRRLYEDNYGDGSLYQKLTDAQVEKEKAATDLLKTMRRKNIRVSGTT